MTAGPGLIVLIHRALDNPQWYTNQRKSELRSDWQARAIAAALYGLEES
jgi:hypothetical protein